MDPDIGTSQGCLKGQITPEHLTLGTGVRQPLGQHWFLSLTGILPLLCFGCFGGPQLHIGLSLCFSAPPFFPICLSLPAPSWDPDIEF